jgi:hypothetical protein
MWSKRAANTSHISTLKICVFAPLARHTTDEPLARITCEWVQNKAPEMFPGVDVQAEVLDRGTEKTLPGTILGEA